MIFLVNLAQMFKKATFVKTMATLLFTLMAAFQARGRACKAWMLPCSGTRQHGGHGGGTAGPGAGPPGSRRPQAGPQASGHWVCLPNACSSAASLTPLAELEGSRPDVERSLAPASCSSPQQWCRELPAGHGPVQCEQAAGRWGTQTRRAVP